MIDSPANETLANVTARARVALASVDTRRMAETTKIGSVRSTGSAVHEVETPNG